MFQIRGNGYIIIMLKKEKWHKKPAINTNSKGDHNDLKKSTYE